MKRIVLLFATLLFSPLSGLADDDCQYIGSWFGYGSDGEISWTSQANGKNSSRGTMLLALPGFDVTFNGAFDVANFTSNIKGTWERTGGNTFSYGGMSFATNPNGDAVWVARVTGDLTVMGDCDVLYVDNTWLSIYFVNVATDPTPIWDRDPDVGPTPFEPHYGYRIKTYLP